MLAWKCEGTSCTRGFRRGCTPRSVPCEPLRDIPKDRPDLEPDLSNVGHDPAFRRFGGKFVKTLESYAQGAWARGRGDGVTLLARRHR